MHLSLDAYIFVFSLVKRCPSRSACCQELGRFKQKPVTGIHFEELEEIVTNIQKQVAVVNLAVSL